VNIAQLVESKGGGAMNKIMGIALVLAVLVVPASAQTNRID
jgi:hypothetical protein